MGKAAAIEIGLVIGIHILVEAAQRIVIAAALPEAEMDETQQLQRLPEGRGALDAHRREHFRQGLVAHFTGAGLIACNKPLQGFDAPHGRLQEEAAFRIGALHPDREALLARLETLGNGVAQVGRDIGKHPVLVEVMAGLEGGPFVRRKIGRHLGNGPGGHNLLALEDDGLLGRGHRLEEHRGAHLGGNALCGIFFT